MRVFPNVMHIHASLVDGETSTVGPGSLKVTLQKNSRPHFGGRFLKESELFLGVCRRNHFMRRCPLLSSFPYSFEFCCLYMIYM